ncbi:cellulose synthase subunit [Algoriphagus ornithinivorans]|uniref:Cellulose synthase subunit n=1 Tax=Algoriphagus ornithinivorans TaxID=226506 RepID=A0A1I5IB35_9BACT|nr:cellulose biosynthesis cyclic di-GMP-binding regulatory protein BcsB [Algoriphagus ornithinivorans]SFO57396.1 cellulose synthase subunit [Algoriphagus ornithinivorans]
MARISTKATSVFLLFLILGISNFANGQTNESPFSDFGYPEQSVIYGPRAGTVFYFKHKPRRDYENSYVHLEIIPSQLIEKKQSTITFLVGDRPVLSTFIGQYSDTIRVDLPLKRSDMASGFVKLEVKSNLFLRDEDCRDYDETGIWLEITPESFLLENFISYPKELPAWTIEEFLPEVERILIPKESLASQLEVASYLHYFFRERIGVNLPVEYLDKSNVKLIHRALVIGSGTEIQKAFSEEKSFGNTAGQGEIKMHYTSQTDSLTATPFFTSSMLLTGPDVSSIEKAIQFLFNSDLTSSALTDHVKVNKSVEKTLQYNYTLKNTYNLEELGMDTEMMTGMGKIRKNLTLPSYLSKATLRSLQLQLKINHKPVSASESGFANIYINNDLIGTYRLNETGILQVQVSPNRVTFATGSYLGIEYIYVPAGGICNTNASEFYAQIDPLESFLSPVFYRNTPLTFASFPKNFEGSPVEIWYDYAVSPKEIPSISKLIQLINTRYSGQSGFYFPKINAVSTANQVADGNTNKVLLTASPENYNDIFKEDQYIRFYKDSISYKSDEVKRFFNVSYGDDLAFIQLFNHNGSKFMMVSNQARNTEAMEMALNGVQDQFLTNSGNVLISNPKRYFFFDLRFKTVLDEEMDSQNRFLSFWETYRLFIIVVVITVIIVLLSYIFKKSESSKKNIEDAR